MADNIPPWNTTLGGVEQTQTSQSWTRNGITWTVNSASPTLPRAATSETLHPWTHSPLSYFAFPGRYSARASHLGSAMSDTDSLWTALDALERMMSDLNISHQQSTSTDRGRSRSSRRGKSTRNSDEEDNLDGYDSRKGRRSTPHVAVFDLREARETPRGQSSRQNPSSEHRQRTGEGRGWYRQEHRGHPSRRKGREAQVEPDRRDSRPSDTLEPMIQALEIAIRAEREAADNCRRQLSDSAGQGACTEVLQSLLSELHGHEAAFESATQNLHDVKAKQERNRRRRAEQDDVPRDRPSKANVNEGPTNAFPDSASRISSSARTRRVPIFELLEDSVSFDAFLKGRYDETFGRMFDNCDSHFEHLRSPPRRSTNSNARDHGRSTRSHRSAFEQTPDPSSLFDDTTKPIPTTQTAGSAPLTRVLQPDEAMRLYQTYNLHWDALSPTDPNVIFPARGFKAKALKAQHTILGPHAPQISTWSEETVMKANVQRFFLGAVGLKPKYFQATVRSKIQMGFDKSQASAQQTKDLIDLLKKEKSRWHSDRLGRRNKNMDCINKALQEDEPARAVFHAVCELMEFAQ